MRSNISLPTRDSLRVTEMGRSRLTAYGRYVSLAITAISGC